MNKYLSIVLLFVITYFSVGCHSGFNRNENKPTLETAKEYVHNHIIVDGHVDMPNTVFEDHADISTKTDNNFDYVKAKKGGLNAPFMSIYIPSSLNVQRARQRADSLIMLVKGIAQDHPEKFAIATSPEEIKKQFEKGLISMAMGMENGSPIGKDLKKIETYYNKGIRYITMAHAEDNLLSDSSYDTDDDSGLTPLGKKAVKKMNQIGIIVDVSHLSDSSFYQVMNITKAPVIASHSGVRHFTPGWERNMNDDMIKALAKNGGVIMINFGSSFLKAGARKSNDKIQAHLDSLRKHHPEEMTDEHAKHYFESHYAFATIEDVADQIDYVVNLVGINHVGLGSDFDGVGNSLPKNLKNAAMLPNLILELMERGYTESELNKITHENVFRVWNKVEQIAQTLSSSSSSDTTATN